jgi:hypothetical protein
MRNILLNSQQTKIVERESEIPLEPKPVSLNGGTSHVQQEATQKWLRKQHLNSHQWHHK